MAARREEIYRRVLKYFSTREDKFRIPAQPFNFFYYIKCDDFPKISDHFSPKARRMFPNISGDFPKIAEDCRRRPKEIRGCFDHIPINLSVVKRDKDHFFKNDIFLCEDIISSHVVFIDLLPLGIPLTFI